MFKITTELPLGLVVRANFATLPQNLIDAFGMPVPCDDWVDTYQYVFEGPTNNLYVITFIRTHGNPLTIKRRNSIAGFVIRTTPGVNLEEFLTWMCNQLNCSLKDLYYSTRD